MRGGRDATAGRKSQSRESGRGRRPALPTDEVLSGCWKFTFRDRENGRGECKKGKKELLICR